MSFITLYSPSPTPFVRAMPSSCAGAALDPPLSIVTNKALSLSRPPIHPRTRGIEYFIF